MKEELPLMLLGYHVRVIPEAAMPPVLQISPDFPHCSPEFRAAWNAWALERFGRQNRILFMQLGPMKIACMTKAMERTLREGVDRFPVWSGYDKAKVGGEVSLEVALHRTGPLGSVVCLSNTT